MKQKHLANADREEKVMKPGRRALATMGLAGVLALSLRLRCENERT
jgi:hypothetical protein